MTIKTYIRSVGQSVIEKPDYTWVFLGDPDPRCEDPPFWPAYQELVPNVYQHVILLGRAANKLFLLIANIDSPYVDNENRRIRHSIAWIGDDNDEELLQAIAVCNLDLHLRESFIKHLNEGIAMNRSNELGFEVDQAAIQDLANGCQHEAKLKEPRERADYASIQEKCSPETLRQFAHEFRAISLLSLGQGDRLLLYVSKRVSDLQIQKYHIWRTLYDEKTPDSQTPKWDDPLRHLKSTPSSSHSSHNRNSLDPNLLLAIIVATALIVIAIRFFFNNHR